MAHQYQNDAYRFSNVNMDGSPAFNRPLNNQSIDPSSEDNQTLRDIEASRQRTDITVSKQLR